MLRIDDFFFIQFNDLNCSPTVNPATFNGVCRLVGVCYGHPNIPDGSYIITSRVDYVKDGYVKTASGSLYKLEYPSGDYAEYLMALRDNIPVFTSWTLTGTNGNYCITGVVNNKSARGYIVEQDGNYITLESGFKCLVLWRNGVNFEYTIQACNGRFLDMSYPYDFEPSMDYICRPCLFRQEKRDP